jgi:hypothetical protein
MLEGTMAVVEKGDVKRVGEVILGPGRTGSS